VDSCCRRLAATLESAVTRTQMRVACAEGMDQPANRGTPGVWNRYPSAPSLAVEVISKLIWPYFPMRETARAMYHRAIARESSSIVRDTRSRGPFSKRCIETLTSSIFRSSHHLLSNVINISRTRILAE